MKDFWHEWRGTLDGIPTMYIRRLIAHNGFRLDLHAFVGVDNKECFHTHPARAIRFVLWGGYIEELEGGTLRIWPPFRAGFVEPSLSHRVAGLLFGRSFSLWLRWPKSAEVELRGTGWAEQSTDKQE